MTPRRGKGKYNHGAAQSRRHPPHFYSGVYTCKENIEAVYRHYGVSDKNGLYTAAGIDGFSVWEWNAVMGRYTRPLRKSNGTELDFWGNAYPGHFGLFHCDSIEALKDHQWPLIEDFDFSHISGNAHRIREKDMPVAAGHLGLGYQMHNMLRGNEKSLMDVMDSQYMAIFMDRLTRFTCEYIELLLSAANGLIDVVRGMMILALWID